MSHDVVTVTVIYGTDFYLYQFHSSFFKYFFSNFLLFYSYNIFVIYFSSNSCLLKSHFSDIFNF